MDAKKMFTDLQKIPVIGDFIIAFAIIVVLTTLSSAGGFWGFEGKEKEFMINTFIVAGIIYFICSTSIKLYFYLKNKKAK